MRRKREIEKKRGHEGGRKRERERGREEMRAKGAYLNKFCKKTINKLHG